MPILRHLKKTPERCNCTMCAHHAATRVVTRWMKANPRKVRYLADGELTSRHRIKFNNKTHKRAKYFCQSHRP